MEKNIIDVIMAAGDGNVWPEFERWLNRETTDTLAAEKAVKDAFPNIEEVGSGLLLVDLETAYKDMGFSNGFKTAVRLMMECMK